MIEKILPAYEWMRGYRRENLAGDVSAGLIVGVMLVPQGMAYAMLAGLPPVVGLYASTVPVLLYALLGSSRQLAVGPVAMVSLLVAARCSSIAPPGSAEYLTAVTTLCVLVGVLQFALGAARMGFVVNFLSHGVISGFTSAAAIIIALSQLKHLLGVPLQHEHSVLGLVVEAAGRLSEMRPAALGVGLIGVGVLAIFRWRLPRFPGGIVVVAGGAVAAYLLDLQQMGVAVVGNVPGGFPRFSPPQVSWADAAGLAPGALAIVFVAFIESIAVARTIAAKERYRVNPNQELRALGLANLGAAVFSGYPVTGGFSRTAVNYQAGARTNLASMVTAAVVTLTLLFLTPLFYYVPKSILAAVIIVAVGGLVDLSTPVRLFRVKAGDGWALVLTFLLTLILGVEVGILSGVGLGLLLFIWRSAHPHTAELGYVESEDAFRDIERYPNARTDPTTLIFRVEASLYFANMQFLEDRLRERIADRPELRWIVMDFSGVNDIDGVAIEALEDLMQTQAEHDIQFLFAGVKATVRDRLAKASWKEQWGDHIDYPTLARVLRDIGVSLSKAGPDGLRG